MGAAGLGGGGRGGGVVLRPAAGGIAVADTAALAEAGIGDAGGWGVSSGVVCGFDGAE